jgi:hypothetical protein
LSYSPIPASKIPLTVKRLNLGCIPIILADSCGTSKVTLLPNFSHSTFVEKILKFVFKSWRFEKHASKSYFKITTINYISFCFPYIKEIVKIVTKHQNDLNFGGKFKLRKWQ